MYWANGTLVIDSNGISIGENDNWWDWVLVPIIPAYPGIVSGVRTVIKWAGSKSILVEEDIGGIASKYGYGKCKEAAEAMATALSKRKKNYTIITIAFVPWNIHSENRVYSDSKNIPVSDNGIHVGVFVHDIGLVFCNIHPTGLIENVWIDDFIAPANYKKTITRVPFIF